METRFTLIINLITFVIVHTSEANVTCTVNDISYICNNIADETDFPLSLPANIRKVTLFGNTALEGSFPNGLFRSRTWSNISELSILEFIGVDFVEKDFLVGLDKLIFLSISSCPDLERIDPGVFHSTPDLEALHLDGNFFLKIYVVEAALNGKLDKLKYLSLIGIQGIERHVFLGENFTKALRTKHLTYLDISGVKTIFVEHVDVVQEVMSNVKYLNLSYSTLLSAYGVQFPVDSFLRNVELKASNANVLLNQFQDKSLIAEKYRYGYNASENTKLEEKQGIIPQFLMLNVLENPLLCDCETLDFVKWILFANIDIVNRTTLTCVYHSNEALLNNAGFEMVEENCRFAHILGIGIGSSAAIMISIIAFGIMIHLRRRKARQHRDLTTLKREILHDNTHFNFVVFLSYCSQDSHIADDIILPSLNKCLKKTFNTQKDLVCTGADSFVPGMLIIDEIHRCIKESLVIVPVITPAFLESRWSLKECVDAIERHRQVVVLMKQHTDIAGTIDTIKHLIAQHTIATWSYNEGQFVIRPSWNTICDGIIQTASETFRNHRRQNCNTTIELVSLVK
ncbi:hypothetical protein CHS0354_019573 [Potamilus streckersoni]|uniref:TIR domain-containing protein n=1 Tax=Potamilus streckersoni TaxID=2493646 RepID=A0AAE0TFT9_9BIVA|nr:hypothetical protein CHS0354_019573 [Potamilus streckersoni]